MIEKDEVRGVEKIGIEIVKSCKVRIKIGGWIWDERRERSMIVLRMVGNIEEKIRSGRMIEKEDFEEKKDENGLKKEKCEERIGIGSILRSLKNKMKMDMGEEIINIVRMKLMDEEEKIGWVCKVEEMKEKEDVLIMRVLIKMVDKRSIEWRWKNFKEMKKIEIEKKKID